MMPSASPVKRTAVEKQVNNRIILLFGLLLVLAVVSTIGSSIRTVSVGLKIDGLG
jgi:phospholipid-transporting ATPase